MSYQSDGKGCDLRKAWIRGAVAVLGGMVLLSGCSRFMNDDRGLIVNRSDDYLKVETRKELEVPDDLSAGRVQEPFSIPEIQNPNGETFPDRAPRPTPILAGTDVAGVKIQKLGDRRWLVLGDAPSVIWPKLKQFLSENGVDTVFEAALSGRITTDWFDVENDEYRDVIRLAVSQGKKDANAAGGRERVNFSVEQGMRENTTEIHVRHQNDTIGSAEDLPDDQLLSAESAVVKVEEGVLRELGSYLASDVSSQSVSRAGQDLVGATKAELATAADGQPMLRLNLDFDRAWASVNQALDNAEVAITDLDRSEGVFFVDLPENLLSGQPQKRGLFGRRKGGELQPLQIHVAPASAGGYRVTATDSDASALAPERAREVLNLIREFAI